MQSRSIQVHVKYLLLYLQVLLGTVGIKRYLEIADASPCIAESLLRPSLDIDHIQTHSCTCDYLVLY